MRSVTRHFDSLEYIPDDAFSVNDKRGPLCVTGRLGEHAESAANRTFRICEKRRLDPLSLREVAVRLNGITRNAHKRCVQAGKVSRPLTEVNSFDSST
jgi:hypothetical protein